MCIYMRLPDVELPQEPSCPPGVVVTYRYSVNPDSPHCCWSESHPHHEQGWLALLHRVATRHIDAIVKADDPFDRTSRGGGKTDTTLGRLVPSVCCGGLSAKNSKFGESGPPESVTVKPGFVRPPLVPLIGHVSFTLSTVNRDHPTIRRTREEWPSPRPRG